MKKGIQITAIIFVLTGLLSTSCNPGEEASNEPAKIENTLQSVSYFKDTIGYETSYLLEVFSKYNAAIGEIGYPDAGYKLWMIQEEDSTGLKYMAEGFWPNQDAYDEIHNHQLYQAVGEDESNNLDGLVWLEYHRFAKIK